MAVDAGARPVDTATDAQPRPGWFDHLDDIPRGWFLAGLTAVLSLPLLIALIALHSPRWYPLLDWAQTEIRVRDVISTHPPLIGLAGRIGPFTENGGSHPGPMSFYALWPVWVLFRGSSFGLYAATVSLDITAIALSLWLAYRRGGATMALAIGAVLAVLMRAYGSFMLTTPWNPYLPVLWWFVFLIAVWSVLCDDWPALIVVVLAGMFAMQTHISYLGLVGGLGVFLAAVLVYRFARKRVHEPRKLLRFGAIATLIFAVLWVPPVIDELAHGHGSCKTPGVTSCGNLTLIREYFSDPNAFQAGTPEKALGARDGVDVFLSQVNPLKLFAKPLVENGNPRPVGGTRIPGALLLVVWTGSVVLAWKRRVSRLLALDAVLGVAVVLGYVSASRILGRVWFYLLLWSWAITALLLFAIVWTAVEYLRSRDHGAGVLRWGRTALVAIIAIVTVVFSAAAATTDVMSPRLNAELAKVTKPTVDALAQARANGARGPYLVTWLPEAQAIGAEGYGLLNELLRKGFDVKAPMVMRPGATRYHVIDPSKATLMVHLATGVDIACWQSHPEYKQVAADDERTPAEQAEFAQLRAQVIDELQRAGRSDLLREVDDGLWGLNLDTSIPHATQQKVARMLALSLPVAVFIGPVGDPHDKDGRCT
jgi:hypothetical protein